MALVSNPPISIDIEAGQTITFGSSPIGEDNASDELVPGADGVSPYLAGGLTAVAADPTILVVTPSGTNQFTATNPTPPVAGTTTVTVSDTAAEQVFTVTVTVSLLAPGATGLLVPFTVA